MSQSIFTDRNCTCRRVVLLQIRQHEVNQASTMNSSPQTRLKLSDGSTF